MKIPKWKKVSEFGAELDEQFTEELVVVMLRIDTSDIPAIILPSSRIRKKTIVELCRRYKASAFGLLPFSAKNVIMYLDPDSPVLSKVN